MGCLVRSIFPELDKWCVSVKKLKMRKFTGLFTSLMFRGQHPETSSAKHMPLEKRCEESGEM